MSLPDAAPDPDSYLPDALEPDDELIDDFDEQDDPDFDPFEPTPAVRRVPPIDPPGFPPIFQYSQDNLQAYSTCARRFQLRHLVRQAWPEPVAESNDKLEDDLRYGDQFHRLVERYTLGVAVSPPTEPPLAVWWQSFLRHPPRDLPADPPIRKVEASYSVPFGDQRLVAKFDLLAIVPGERIVIVDWKTSTARPDRRLLADRWQTAVYLYVAAEALAREFGAPDHILMPEAISLVYWFANAPDQPIVFQHSAANHDQYRARLRQITGSIAARVTAGENVWPLTDDLRRCQTCTYRVLCDRTLTPNTGSTPDLSDEPIALDGSFFDDTAEVEL